MALDASVAFVPSNLGSNAGSKLLTGLNSFSSPPTIAEINASSWINQIIALVNRRMYQTIVSPSYYSYYSNGQYLSASQLESIKTTINAVRTNCNLSSFSFTGTFHQGDKVSAARLTELKTALNFSSLTKINSNGDRFWSASEAIYNGTQTGIVNRAYANDDLGKHCFTTSITRSRLGMNFSIPSWIVNSSGLEINHRTNLGSFTNTMDNPWRPAIYCSSTDDSSYSSGWWNNTNSFGGYGQYNVSVQDVSIPASIVYAKKGVKLSVVMGQEFELLGTGTGVSGSNQAIYGNLGIGTRFLNIDYGY